MPIFRVNMIVTLTPNLNPNPLPYSIASYYLLTSIEHQNILLYRRLIPVGYNPIIEQFSLIDDMFFLVYLSALCYIFMARYLLDLIMGIC